MIYSRLKYGSIITGQTSQGNLDKIQILQNKLLKVLSCKNYRHPTNKLHNELSILKFEDMVKQETLSFMHNYVYGNLPKVFKNYFEHRHQLTDMKSEHRKRRFTLPKSNHDIGKSTVKYVGTKLFNDEAPLLKLDKSIHTYRKHIKTMYLNYPEN